MPSGGREPVHCFAAPSGVIGESSAHGPGGRPVLLHLDDEWLGVTTGLPIPLYVGKNADSMAKRIGQHLRLKDDRTTPEHLKAIGSKSRPTTSCQALRRDRRILPREWGILATSSWIMSACHGSCSAGDDQAANRFYLEDLAIGQTRPILNIDVER